MTNNPNLHNNQAKNSNPKEEMKININDANKKQIEPTLKGNNSDISQAKTHSNKNLNQNQKPSTSTIAQPKMNYKINDNKNERIIFIVDMHEEVLQETFLRNPDDPKSKCSRFDIIFEEITSFIRLKGYISANQNEFSLYLLTDSLMMLSPYLPAVQFLNQLKENYSNTKRVKYNKPASPDLSEIFDLAEMFKVNEDYITRVIMYYNRSHIPISIKKKAYCLENFIKAQNFYFDLVFLRNKVSNDSEKKKMKIAFQSLTDIKTKFWYSFENSGNLQKLKFITNLLVASPTLRIQHSKIDSYLSLINETLNEIVNVK